MRITNYLPTTWRFSPAQVVPKNPIVRIALLALAIGVIAIATYKLLTRQRVAPNPPGSPPPAQAKDPVVPPPALTVLPVVPKKPSDQDVLATCRSEWPALSFDQILTEKREQLDQVLNLPVDHDLRRILLEKTAGIPVAEILQKCPLLFRNAYFQSWNCTFDILTLKKRPTFRQRLEAETKSLQAYEAIVNSYGAGFNELKLFSAQFMNFIAAQQVLTNLERYLDNEAELADKPACIQEIFQRCDKKLERAAVLANLKTALEKVRPEATY